jgi:hypothetical protein
MDYEDLILQLNAESAGGYTVRVARSPAGETDPEPLSVPFSEAELDRLGEALGRAARQLRPPVETAVQETTLAEVGDRLFRALFTDAVKNRYHESLGRVSARRECGLRIKVQMGLGNPALTRLHVLPWEYLRATEDGHFLGLSRETSIVRYLDLRLPGDRPPVPPPLAILVLAGEDETGDLDLARERRAIERAWPQRGAVSLTFLARPTLESLRDELLAHDYHVLHFMGHGGFDASAGEGSIAFRDEHGRRIWVSGSELAEHLRDRLSLRLVFLNACWTARAISAGPYAGVATALLGAGVPAVLAMQFSISDAAALAFSRVFYRRLAQGDAIDAAVTEGRMAIRRLKYPVVEWGTPVLFERLTSGNLVRKTARPLALGRVAVLAGILLLGGIALVWRAHSPPVETGTAGRGEAPLSTTADQKPAEPHNDQPPSPVLRSGNEPARGSQAKEEKSEKVPSDGSPQTSRSEEPHPASAPKTYTLTPSEPLFIQELATSVSAEFSQIGRESYLTLHLTPPGSPTLHQTIFGPTDVDLGPGKGHLQVQSIDWDLQIVRLLSQPLR